MPILLELFSGTGSIGKVAKKLGLEVISIDIVEKFKPSIVADLLTFDYKTLPIPDYIWASPPCTSFSKLVCSHKNPSRDCKTLKPLNETAKLGDKLLIRTIKIIKYFQSKNPKLKYVFENPVGMMRRMKQVCKIKYTTVTYCKYGFNYKKPTDLWNNFDLKLKDQCTAKDRCTYYKKHGNHLSSQRQSKTTLYRIPPRLGRDILKQMIA